VPRSVFEFELYTISGKLVLAGRWDSRFIEFYLPSKAALDARLDPRSGYGSIWSTGVSQLMEVLLMSGPGTAAGPTE
jgi:hypothetical protein